MLTCDFCGNPFELGDGLYDDGEFMCGCCIAGFSISLKADQLTKHNKQRKNKESLQSHSSRLEEKPNKSKIKKARNLSKNILCMLKKGGGLRIRRDNEQAFYLAVKQLGMRLGEFIIESDYDAYSYLEISLKRDLEKEKVEIPPLLNRPKWTKKLSLKD